MDIKLKALLGAALIYAIAAAPVLAKIVAVKT
jgi:hypothetical protein